MCGRYTMRTSCKVVAEVFALADEPLFQPRFNIAPTQQVPVVRLDEKGRHLAFMRWGLIPHWADDPAIGNRMINTRAETAATKPSFRGPFRHHRCLVVADGFYEWQKTDGKKHPFYIRLRDDKPFAFAGLWDHWDRGEEPIDSCTILTTDANETVKIVHDRMPVILAPKDFAAWFDPDLKDPKSLESLLRPYPGDAMVAYPVSTLVNNPRNENPRCLEPAQSG